MSGIMKVFSISNKFKRSLSANLECELARHATFRGITLSRKVFFCVVLSDIMLNAVTPFNKQTSAFNENIVSFLNLSYG
jgi:hypothetical protein